MSPSLDSGLELSHFRILAPLGEGGMGEVYRAWDTELDREVALKVLPPSTISNPERLTRFVKEAKSASTLAHPNIITIYEIGHQVVSTEPVVDIHYIAMELIDGLTLKQHIHDCRTELKTLLGFLEQAARGLAKAHEAGVVHRDLKPDNIMVTGDGYSKVLDFGLAKLNPLNDPGAEATSAPTVVDEVTAEGVMMGTIGYMSPEQARATPLDHRTDIFSFGCILYEAATRQRPFVADSSIDTLHQILHDDPPAMEIANPSVPGALRRMVKRCLAKDPDRRAQSMKDIALELSELIEEFDSLSPASVSSVPTPNKQSRPASDPAGAGARTSKSPTFALLGVLAIAVVFALIRNDRPSDPPSISRSESAGFQAMEIEPITSDGTITVAALSPDGRYLAHTRTVAGKLGLWIRQIATGSEIQIVAPEDLTVSGVVFTPDGEYLYFLRSDPEQTGYRTLFRVPTLGGESRKILFDVDAGVAISADGRQIAFPRGIPQGNRSVLVVADADGTNERELVSLTAPDRFLMASPAWSPDNRVIVAAIPAKDDPLTIEFTSIEIATGTTRPLPGNHRFARMSAIEWLPDGSGLIVVARQGTLDKGEQIWRIEYPSGTLSRISNDLNSYRGLSINADGSTMATVMTETVTQLYVAPSASPARFRQLTSGPREAIYDVEATLDGSVIVQRHRLEHLELWRMFADGSEPQRLATDGSALGPAISNDGTELVAGIYFENQRPHIWRLDPQTGALTDQLTDGDGEVNVALSPDGKWLMYGQLGNQNLELLEMETGETTTVAERFRGRPEFSSDSRFFAHGAFEDIDGQGRPVIKIYSRENHHLLQILPWDMRRFFWHPDGDAMVSVRHQQQASNLWRVPLDGSEATQITSFDRDFIIDADWSPDGEWLYVTRGSTTSDVVLIRNFR